MKITIKAFTEILKENMTSRKFPDCIRIPMVSGYTVHLSMIFGSLLGNFMKA